MPYINLGKESPKCQHCHKKLSKKSTSTFCDRKCEREYVIDISCLALCSICKTNQQTPDYQTLHERVCHDCHNNIKKENTETDEEVKLLLQQAKNKQNGLCLFGDCQQESHSKSTFCSRECAMNFHMKVKNCNEKSLLNIFPDLSFCRKTSK